MPRRARDSPSSFQKAEGRTPRGAALPPIPYPGGNRPEGYRQTGFFADHRPRLEQAEAERSSSAAKGAWPVSDESTTVLQGFLGRAIIGSHVLSAGPSVIALFTHQADN